MKEQLALFWVGESNHPEGLFSVFYPTRPQESGWHIEGTETQNINERLKKQ